MKKVHLIKISQNTNNAALSSLAAVTIAIKSYLP